MRYNKFVKVWLLLGLFMLFMQIVVGGITRLTGSGLSITKWEIITGTLPPMTDASWQIEFEEYKKTPQYEKINLDMEMGNIFTSGTFKFIYFWEYIHRLWARLMGFVFLFPCLLFMALKWVDKPLLKRLGIVILLAALAATFGWIMVASGLIERPWVNAYKLAMHLCIGISVFAMMLWTCFYAFNIRQINVSSTIKRYFSWFTVLLAIQIFFGGVMSGMKAGLFYPTWPDMNGEFIPQIVFDISQYTVDNFNNYDQNTLLPSLIQVIHRSLAYVLTTSGLYIFIKSFNTLKLNDKSVSAILFISLLISQVVLGIVTLVNCKGSIPVELGAMHQGLAVILLGVCLFHNYMFKRQG